MQSARSAKQNSEAAGVVLLLVGAWGLVQWKFAGSWPAMERQVYTKFSVPSPSSISLRLCCQESAATTVQMHFDTPTPETLLAWLPRASRTLNETPHSTRARLNTAIRALGRSRDVLVGGIRP